MKKLLILAMVAVLVCSFALTAASKGKPVCDDRECYIDQGCDYDPDTGLYYCWYDKCCREQYFYKGKCVWTDWVCASLIP